MEENRIDDMNRLGRSSCRGLGSWRSSSDVLLDGKKIVDSNKDLQLKRNQTLF